MYSQLEADCRDIKATSDDIIADQRAHLFESLQHIEILGARLEYQINNMESKVADAEDGVLQFQSQVENIENRVLELESFTHAEGWLHWIVRNLTGIGSE